MAAGVSTKAATPSLVAIDGGHKSSEPVRGSGNCGLLWCSTGDAQHCAVRHLLHCRCRSDCLLCLSVHPHLVVPCSGEFPRFCQFGVHRASRQSMLDPILSRSIALSHHHQLVEPLSLITASRFVRPYSFPFECELIKFGCSETLVT